MAPGYHAKDKSENKLHALVCAGQMTLHAAHYGWRSAGGYFLQGNSSNFNGGNGIYACAYDWVNPGCGGMFNDGGGNFAKRNGDVQCVNIVCAAKPGQARKETAPRDVTH